MPPPESEPVTRATPAKYLSGAAKPSESKAIESSASANMENKTGATEPSGSAHEAGFQDKARTTKKARLPDVEIRGARLQEASGVPLTEAAVKKMNEAVAEQDKLRRAERENNIKRCVAEQDEAR